MLKRLRNRDVNSNVDKDFTNLLKPKIHRNDENSFKPNTRLNILSNTQTIVKGQECLLKHTKIY